MSIVASDKHTTQCTRVPTTGLRLSFRFQIDTSHMRHHLTILCCLVSGCGTSPEVGTSTDNSPDAVARQATPVTVREADVEGTPQKERMNWHQVCDKWSDDGYDSLSDAEQVWVCTRGFIDSVNDGGLVSFFFNSAADNYDDTVFALGELEASEVLEILEAFGAFFGDEVPDDINERNAIIDSWVPNGPEATASQNVDKALMPLLDALEKRLNEYLVSRDLDPN
jgi:hypothetical protein